MDLFDGPNGFVGREVVFRPIEFERYRKPCVVAYPRHAIVLNPQHTHALRHNTQANGSEYSKEADEERGSDESSSAERNGNDAKRGDSEDDDEEDDPLYMEDAIMLCGEEQLRRLMHLRWQQVGPSGRGLQNLGNTCFANSVLQAIAYTPALAQYFSSHFKAPYSHVPGSPYDYAYALGETVRNIHAPSNGAYRPGLIMSNLKALSPHFRLGRQSDAHEFAVHLLHACHQSVLFRQVGSKKLTPRVEQTSALHRIIGSYLRSRVSWSCQEEIERLKNVGKVQETIDLKMKLNQKGTPINAPLVSNTYDPTIIFNVEVAGHTLDHCLGKFCEKETLDGRSYHSPRGVGVRATKQFQIHKLPHVFIIHLKRFNIMRGKVSKFVQYPLVLNVAPFCTQEGLERAVGRRNLDKDNPKCLYELNAICVHDGSSLNYGHYYSIVRARNGTWLVCNDENVSHCSEERALGQQAYMLFYSKIEVSQPTKNRAAKNGFLPERIKSKISSEEAPIQHDKDEKDVGRPLNEEELKRIMKERKSQSTLTTPNHPENSKNQPESRKRSSDSTNASHPQTNGISSHDNEDDNDHDDEYDNDTTTNGYHHDSEEEDARRTTNGIAMGKRSASPVTTLRRTEPRHMYRGIVKAMHRTHPTPPAKPSELGENGVAPHTAKGERTSTLLGERVAQSVEDRRSECTPATVARPKHAPKFRQRVKDSIWEEEMDRGRIKKVRVKHEEYNGENKFDNSGISFDIRGRRIRKNS